ALPICGGIVAGDLIAPGGLIGVLHNGQKFDMGVAHVLAVGGQLPGQLYEVEAGAVFVALPGAGMDLIDIHGLLEAVAPGILALIGGVVPDVPLQGADAAGGVGQLAALGTIGVHFQDGVAALGSDGVFVRLTFLGKC